MKAIRFHRYGNPEELVLDDVPMPEVGPDEVLVKIHAAAVNPADFKFRAGWFKDFVPLPLPFIPGADFSGTVEKAGPLVSRFKIGDEVFGMRDVQAGGSYAEYTAVRGDTLAHKPANLSHAQAAGVPLAALTAWSALFDYARIRPGQTLLVHAAAGGVGSFAVQLARQAGARVVATGSSANVELLRTLGADEVIDYRVTDFTRVLKDLDVVLDTLGGDAQTRSFGVLRSGGLLVTLQPPGVDEAMARSHGVRTALVAVSPHGGRTAELAALLQAGRLKVLIDQTFNLAEAGAAHARSESGHARGKIVLNVR
jgi:NADPH:quinone reductase-like Zn-dependent oxidoreductase